MPLPNPTRAIVTGGASGLGRALCLDLASRGAHVVVSDLRPEGAEQTAELIRQAGGRASVIQCDVADREQVFSMVNRAQTMMGGLDFIANNAGVGIGGVFGETSFDDWRLALDINLWGVIHGCEAALPKLREQGRGYIVNVASAAGLLAPPRMAAYNVTKAGVVALSETLYTELKPSNIHVAVVCPTFFKTDLLSGPTGSSSPKEHSRVQKWMERSKIQAPDVAKATLDGARQRKLYIQPMRDGRMAWRFKRLKPQTFYDSLAAAEQKFASRTKR